MCVDECVWMNVCGCATVDKCVDVSVDGCVWVCECECVDVHQMKYSSSTWDVSAREEGNVLEPGNEYVPLRMLIAMPPNGIPDVVLICEM